jgi:uncharacterized lipoprotein YajG
MKKIALVLCPLLLTLTGCVFAPQSVRIMPKISVADSSAGNGVTVAVNVVDERPDKSIGKRGASGMGADIMPADKVEVAVQQAIVDGLKKKGFVVVDPNGTSPAKLVVEVRFLQYSLSTGFWSGGVNVKVALKALASANGKSYDRLYRRDREERVQIAPTAETNEKWINDALSQTIQEMLDDNALISTLAQKN